jgi:hypothetical protein
MLTIREWQLGQVLGRATLCSFCQQKCQEVREFHIRREQYLDRVWMCKICAQEGCWTLVEPKLVVTNTTEAPFACAKVYLRR